MASPSSLSDADFMDACVLVTGAASGLGAATARLFASLGAHVEACGRKDAKITALAQEIAQLMHSLITNPTPNGEVLRLDGTLRLGMR